MQRKIAARIFTGKNFRSHFMSCFVEHGRAVQALLAKQLPTGQVVDIQDTFFRYTLDCIGKLGFGVALGCLDGDEVRPASLLQPRPWE
jgi:hypothetical protein